MTRNCKRPFTWHETIINNYQCKFFFCFQSLTYTPSQHYKCTQISSGTLFLSKKNRSIDFYFFFPSWLYRAKHLCQSSFLSFTDLIFYILLVTFMCFSIMNCLFKFYLLCTLLFDYIPPPFPCVYHTLGYTNFMTFHYRLRAAIEHKF